MIIRSSTNSTIKGAGSLSRIRLGCWRLLKRLCFFTRSPNTGEIVRPLIRNFVDSPFDSSDHMEHQEHFTEMIVCERRGEIRVSSEPAMDQHQPENIPQIDTVFDQKIHQDLENVQGPLNYVF